MWKNPIVAGDHQNLEKVELRAVEGCKGQIIGWNFATFLRITVFSPNLTQKQFEILKQS